MTIYRHYKIANSAGPIPDYIITNRTSNCFSTNFSCLFVQESINKTLLKFWELEEYPAEGTVTISAEEQQCENHFVNTMSRDESGRFVVRLPFRDNKNNLGESREIAMRRLSYLRKFKTNQDFYNQYSRFMREYIELGHMSITNREPCTVNPVYLPHHGVFHESSITTKLRVVFDGSVKITGISLNGTLMIGARLQNNLIDIILRFRLHTIAITTDLRKMYRQVLVHEADRDYQRILWRSSMNEPIQDFRLNIVTYELSCAPFLAVRCVRYLASNANEQLRQASQVLLNDLYVDDVLTGVNSSREAVELIKQLKKLLNDGGFEPHKWRSNCKEILRELGSGEQIEESLAVASDANETNIKTLGLNWHPERDVFEFSIHSITRSSKTKREVLSAISRLFDPLGLISPILVRAKLIMQRTWAANLKWDDQLTDELQNAWIKYADDLKDINAIQVPRRIILSASANRFYLHAFCDASMKAYGACAYLQTIDRNNKSSSALICSKSRVAPIKNKTISLPRLELCGAVVLVRLLKHVRETLKVEFSEIYA